MLDKIFRVAHNLKGSSKAVGFEGIGVFTHRLESFLLQVKNGEIHANSSVIRLLLVCNDHIRSMVDTLKGDPSARIDSSELMARIESASQGEAQAGEPHLSQTESPVVEVAEDEIFDAPTREEAELIRLVNHSFDAGGSISSVVAESAPVVKAATSASAPEKSIRVSLARLEKLINSVGELVILQTVLREQSLSSNAHLLRRIIHQMGKVTKDDGGGIDGARLTAKAIEKGILKLGTVLPEQEAIHLIFHTGFSTKTQVTEVSGRGGRNG